ncbi:MAG: succinate dehydrogenase, cytochrome b556 subunit [Bacteroidota bacterium]
MLQPDTHDTGSRYPWYHTLLGYHKFSGSWAWIIHRLTGIGLITYIVVHIYTLSSLQKGKETFDIEMRLFTSPFFLFLEWALGAFILYHALNGIRIVLIDLGSRSKYHKALYYIAWTVGIILLVIMAILIFGPHIDRQ